MGKNKIPLLLFFFLSLLILSSGLIFAEQTGALTQEQFAVQLVKNMKLEEHLPAAALPGDCVDLLENLGISPLKGWDKKAKLTEEDYTVIIAKAVGQEKVVFIKAGEICQKTIKKINKRWQENPKLSLEELLNDKNIFSQGRPQCPYGLKYKHRNHTVERHFHPLVFFRE